MRNEHSNVFDPYTYDEIIRIGRQTILNDIETEGLQPHIFSNTDSIGFSHKHIDPKDAVARLNSKYTYLKYDIEHQFRVVWFANVNKYIGVTLDDELVLKGFPETLRTNDSAQSLFRALLLNPDFDVFKIASTHEIYAAVVKFFNDDRISSSPLIDEIQAQSCEAEGPYTLELIGKTRSIIRVKRSELKEFIESHKNSYQIDEITDQIYARNVRLVLDLDQSHISDSVSRIMKIIKSIITIIKHLITDMRAVQYEII